MTITRTALRSALARIPSARGIVRTSAKESLGLWLWVSFALAHVSSEDAQPQFDKLLAAAKIVKPSVTMGDTVNMDPIRAAFGPFDTTEQALVAARGMHAVVPLENVLLELHEENHICVVIPSGMTPDEMLPELHEVELRVGALTLALASGTTELALHRETPPDASED